MLPAEVVFINNEDKVVPRTKNSPLLYRRRFFILYINLLKCFIMIYGGRENEKVL